MFGGQGRRGGWRTDISDINHRLVHHSAAPRTPLLGGERSHCCLLTDYNMFAPPLKKKDFISFVCCPSGGLLSCLVPYLIRGRKTISTAPHDDSRKASVSLFCFSVHLVMCVALGLGVDDRSQVHFTNVDTHVPCKCFGTDHHCTWASDGEELRGLSPNIEIRSCI